MLSFSQEPLVYLQVSTGVIPHGTLYWILAAILAIILLNEFLWYAFVAHVFSFARVRAGYGYAKRWVDRVFGMAIAAFGIRIAVT